MSKQTIYMGFDSREKVTYDVARHSILTRTSVPTRIVPIEIDNPEYQKILTRPIEKRKGDNDVTQLWCPISDAPMSTEFAISRFIVPFITKGGWVLFMDPDMVALDDISKLFEFANKENEKFAVMVVKHDHQPTEEKHDAGQLQTSYPRKNWSSLVLWNLDHHAHKKFTVKELNTWPGRDLHAFKWLKDEEIGELPQEWNFLVGVNEGDLEKQKILHYTNGQPGWQGWEPQETDKIWNDELAQLQKDKSVYYQQYLDRIKK